MDFKSLPPSHRLPSGQFGKWCPTHSIDPTSCVLLCAVAGSGGATRLRAGPLQRVLRSVRALVRPFQHSGELRGASARGG